MSWNILVLYYYTGNNFFTNSNKFVKVEAHMKLSRKCEENCEGKKGKENSMESNEQTYAKDPFFLSLIQIIQIKHSSNEVQKELLKIKN